VTRVQKNAQGARQQVVSQRDVYMSQLRKETYPAGGGLVVNQEEGTLTQDGSNSIQHLFPGLSGKSSMVKLKSKYPVAATEVINYAT